MGSIQKQQLDESINLNEEKDQELRDLQKSHNDQNKSTEATLESTTNNTINSELQSKYENLEIQYKLLKEEIEKQQANILFFKEENRKKDENIRKFKEDFLPFLNSYFEKT